MIPDFYLASRSPRRVELLRGIGYRFQSLPADIQETPRPGETAERFALRMAGSKARVAAARAPRPLPVLAADTDVAIDDQILGKPAGREEALRMLQRLSDRRHRVCSAVALLQQGVLSTRLCVTEILFGRITPEDAERYWHTGEPADKAGAYAIQGGAARWVREICGSYTAVVGLPLYEACELLQAAGVRPQAEHAG